jgi:hypothetical protein
MIDVTYSSSSAAPPNEHIDGLLIGSFNARSSTPAGVKRSSAPASLPQIQ